MHLRDLIPMATHNVLDHREPITNVPAISHNMFCLLNNKNPRWPPQKIFFFQYFCFALHSSLNGQVSYIFRNTCQYYVKLTIIIMF